MFFFFLSCMGLEWCSADGSPVRNVTRTLADFRLTAATCATSLLNREHERPNSEKPRAQRKRAGKCEPFGSAQSGNSPAREGERAETLRRACRKGNSLCLNGCWENAILSHLLIASNSWRWFVFSFIFLCFSTRPSFVYPLFFAAESEISAPPADDRRPATSLLSLF